MDAFSDLGFFALLIKQGSLAAAAQQMGLTPPAASKRLAAIERRLGVRLLNRTTRRFSLTPEGETYWVQGAQVLADLEALEQQVAGARAEPRGLLRVAATLGFGRQQLGPILARFAQRWPALELQLHLSDRPQNLVESGMDVLLRFGQLPDARLSARLLAHNQRVLCAAPAYLAQHGVPATPRELTTQHCIVLREADETFGSWQLHSAGRQETVKVRGPLSTNDGATALAWALAGHGIVMRSLWEAAPLLQAGQLQRVLPEWTLADADIYVVFSRRQQLSAKVRALVDFLLDAFASHRHGPGVVAPWSAQSGRGRAGQRPLG